MRHAELLFQLRAKRDRQHRLRIAVAVIVMAVVFYWLANSLLTLHSRQPAQVST